MKDVATAVASRARPERAAEARRTGGDVLSATERAALSLTAGSVSGAAATLSTYPLDLLRTRLAAQGEPRVCSGMLDAMRTVMRQGEGVRALYVGLTPTLVQIVPYAGVQFLVYDSLSSALKRRNENGAISGLETFCVGVTAGLSSKIVVHPLDLAKKRLQVAGLQRSLTYGARISRKTYDGLWHALTVVARTEGVRGLYKGLAPALIKAAPNAAITFWCFEWASAQLAERFSEESK